MRRLIAAACALGAVMLIAVSVGVAATPQQIYRDYADNGRLDRHYSGADLQRALKDAVLQGYPTHKGTKPAIKKQTGQQGNQGQQGVAGGQKSATAPPVKSTGGLPFTGLDLALISIGGVLLLAFGAGLRRFARRTS
jgi:hypothetical protein